MRVEVNGIGLEVQVHGPDDGRPVLLLHGWPDRADLWRHQVPALVDAGHRVVAPDLRGFGDSDKPADVASYSILHSAADVTGVLDHLGIERAAVVGHDWGAGLAWALAAFLPERVERLAALSVGHPVSFRNAGLRQLELSWYMLLFQFEGVAEQWLRDDGWANLAMWANHPDHERVVRDLERPGALTASLGWYRANVPPASRVGPAVELPPIACPVMGLSLIHI